MERTGPLTKLASIDQTNELNTILEKTDGIWSKEAEAYLLRTVKNIDSLQFSE